MQLVTVRPMTRICMSVMCLEDLPNEDRCLRAFHLSNNSSHCLSKTSKLLLAPTFARKQLSVSAMPGHLRFAPNAQQGSSMLTSLPIMNVYPKTADGVGMLYFILPTVQVVGDQTVQKRTRNEIICRAIQMSSDSSATSHVFRYSFVTLIT